MFYVILAIVLVFLFIIFWKKDDDKEGMLFSNPIDKLYWPYYYYTYPYHYVNNTGAFPPGLHSRLYEWGPNYASGSGWGWWLRPGSHYEHWPRSVWVRKNNKHYFINNGIDGRLRKFDYY